MQLGGGLPEPGDLAARATPALLEGLDRIALDPDEPIKIQFTPGTTGQPKGATLSRLNIVNNRRFVTDRIALTPARPRRCPSRASDNPAEKCCETVGRIHPQLEVRIVGEGGCTPAIWACWTSIIVGRVKATIIRGAENIYPRDRGIPDPPPADARGAGLRHPRRPLWRGGLRPVRVPQRRTMDPRALRAHCKGQITHFKVPRHVRGGGADLPMNLTGKPQKFVMRDRMVEMLRPAAVQS